MSDQEKSRKNKMAAKRKVMDLVARRDHSEKELRQKLRDKFSNDEDSKESLEELIQEAIDYAKDNRWLGDPQEMAYRLADMLHRRNKGIYYINNYLREKGLPSVDKDQAQELEKALDLVHSKWGENSETSREEKARIGRFLAARGFDSETVRKVIYEKL